MKSARYLMLVTAVAAAAAVALTGCSRAGRTPATQGAALPEWAPKNPSPEFQRAAKVIKPNPPQAQQKGAEANAAQAALDEAYRRTLPAAWEFFGTLSDEQIQQFRAAREIRLPVTSLTPKQRAALNNFFNTWRQAMKDAPPIDQNWLTQLRMFGATEDFSNVEVTFDVRPSGIVRMTLAVRQPDGTTSPPLPIGLGHI
jgi:hypothetical protein